MIVEKLRVLAQIIRTVISGADQACAERDRIIAERDATIEQLQTEIGEGNQIADNLIAEITPAPDPNPTAATDELVKAADKSSVDNTDAVQDAIDNTVDTDQPTSEDALTDAIEMLSQADGAVGTDEEE